MRILKFFSLSFVVLAILACLVFLLGREVLLIWGTTRVESAITELQGISRNARTYITACREKGTLPDQPPIGSLQLRFINSTEFRLEVICTQFLMDPIVVKALTLPPLVKKVPGSSGVIWGPNSSSVQLEVLGRRRTITVESYELKGVGAKLSPTNVTPVASCEAFGYSCCQDEIESGQGNVVNNVTDCPRSCFRTCLPRPVVLSFTTDPFPEQQTRVVSVASGESLTFSFTISPANTQKQSEVQVKLDFGDGQSATFNTLSEQAVHAYTCTIPTGCKYVAQLSATDTMGISAAATPLTRVTVQVN